MESIEIFRLDARIGQAKAVPRGSM